MFLWTTSINQYKILILYSEILMSLKQFKDTYVKNMKGELCHIVYQNISNYTQVMLILTFLCLPSIESNLQLMSNLTNNNNKYMLQALAMPIA